VTVRLYEQRPVAGGIIYTASRSPRFLLVATEAELPISGVSGGDLAYAQDTERFFRRTAAAWVDLADPAPRAAGLTIDGSGAAVTTGLKGFVQVPFAGVIMRWGLLADQPGSVVIDVWKASFKNAPPSASQTIAGSEKPTLANQQKAEDSSLNTWATAVAAGDVIGFYVESASTVTRVSLTIWITPS